MTAVDIIKWQKDKARIWIDVSGTGFTAFLYEWYSKVPVETKSQMTFS